MGSSRKRAKMIFIPLLCLAAILGGLAAYTAIMSARIAAQFPPRGKFVAVEGGRLHYLEKPAKGATRATVLLLHGASGSGSDMMLPLGDGLAARGFRVLAIDRPGMGWSDRPDGRADADPARQAALIRQALDHLDVKSVIVVGHSLAGMAATALALDDADITRGLVLVSPVTHPWPGGGVTWYYGIATMPVVGELFTHLFALPLGMAVMDKGLASVFEPQQTPPDYDERTGVTRLFRPATFRANAQDVAAAYDAVVKQAPRLHEIKAPTSIVTGDHDSIVLTRVHSYGSARDIPGATLHVLPGIGHSPHWANPGAVIDAVEEVATRADDMRSAAQ
jgi:pimeloyl-ACP methyl ester carboxylesterase